jgi:thiol-disulfide isomerase/thioredoxin
LAAVAVFGSAIAIGCGDDGTTSGETVTAPVAPTVSTTESLSVTAGDEVSITATVVNPDDLTLAWAVNSTTIEDLAELGQFEASNTGATLSFPSSAEMVGSHEVTFGATFGEDVEISATATVTIEPEPCFYPSNVGFGHGLAFADFAWNAMYHDGTPVILDLYDFYCDDAEWGDYSSMLFLITTDWCPNCPAYIQWIDALSPQLEEAGMLIFYLDVQNNEGRTTYTPASNEHVGNYTPNESGIRAGDGDNTQPDGVVNSGLVEYFPTSFVIRRSDMSLVADQRDTSYYLPLVEIAQDPDADWSSPPQPGIVPDLPTNCEEGDEEASEPNNSPEEAADLTPGEVSQGGVCDSQPDFYNIDIAGAWTVNLEFSTNLGDLDVYVWDNDAQAPAQGEDGSAIGAESTTDDETFSHSGPASIMIYGFRGATAPYSLTVTAD